MSQTGEQTREAGTKDVRALMRLVEAGAPDAHFHVVLLGLKSCDTAGLVKKLHEGLSFSSLERMQKNLDLPLKELAELVDMSTRTLARRRARGRLEPDESDRLVRLSRVFAQTIELFEGDVVAARSWLRSSQPAFGGLTPFEMLKTEVGSREVEALIGRLEHGVFS